MTPRLHISLIAPGIQSLTLTQWAFASLTVCCLVLTSGLWWHGHGFDEQTSQLQTRIGELDQANLQLINTANSQGFDLSDTRRQELPKELTFINTIRTHQSFSWTQFLNDLEATVPEKISMESVTLNFKDAAIALQGSAATLSDLNLFVDALENHRAFHDVVLSRHSYKTKKGNKKHQFVVFTMKVAYKALPA